MSLEIAGEFDQGNFFRLVDEGLKPALHGKPLLLMGVRERNPCLPSQRRLIRES
jgi:hypothetical protein